MDANTVAVEDALNVLKSPDRRRILEYLDDESVESTTVEELASHLATAESDPDRSESRDERTLAMRLHHIHLPKLDDHGVLEYEPRSNAVRCRSDAHVEKLTDRLRDEF